MVKADGKVQRFIHRSVLPLGQLSWDADPAHWGLSNQKRKQVLKNPESEGQRATSFHIQKI